MKKFSFAMGLISCSFVAAFMCACEEKERCLTDTREGEDICCAATFPNGEQEQVSIYRIGSVIPEENYTFEAGCSPCVAEVCQRRPSCCSEGWYDAEEKHLNQCSDLAREICPSDCGQDGQICCPFIGGYGDRSIFVPHDGGHFEDTCHPWVLQACRELPECCTTEWTEECADMVRNLRWQAEHPSACDMLSTCAQAGIVVMSAQSAAEACSKCPGASLDCTNDQSSDICIDCGVALDNWAASQGCADSSGTLCGFYKQPNATCTLH